MGKIILYTFALLLLAGMIALDGKSDVKGHQKFQLKRYMANEVP